MLPLLPLVRSLCFALTSVYAFCFLFYIVLEHISLILWRHFRRWIAYARHLLVLSIMVSILCHTCFNLGPQPLRFHPEHFLNLFVFYDKLKVLKTYSKREQGLLLQIFIIRNSIFISLFIKAFWCPYWYLRVLMILSSRHKDLS